MAFVTSIPRLFWLAALTASGCSFDTSLPEVEKQNDDAGTEFIDANSSDRPDADPCAPLSTPVHLLLSEVRTKGNGKEFIEIYNPTDEVVSIEHYYLADNNFYAKLPQFRIETEPSETLENSDFIVTFPTGSTIASKAVVVIGVKPDPFAGLNFRILGQGGTAMEQAFPGSLGTQPSLTDSGEPIILFFWDGHTNLVTDVDIFISGKSPTNNNALKAKTNLTIAGPSGPACPSAYLSDSLLMTPLVGDPTSDTNYNRVKLEGFFETNFNGNGVGGHDESSENTRESWELGPGSPGSAAL